MWRVRVLIHGAIHSLEFHASSLKFSGAECDGRNAQTSDVNSIGNCYFSASATRRLRLQIDPHTRARPRARYFFSGHQQPLDEFCESNCIRIDFARRCGDTY
jgi:hypothetical protein